MASENETVAEAIAVERDHIERAKADAEDLEIECTFHDCEVSSIIDRIEAAHGREVAELRRRLKVAEDALECAKGSITRDCTNDCDHLQECCNSKGCLCEQRINNALAAIREEGGAS